MILFISARIAIAQILKINKLITDFAAFYISQHGRYLSFVQYHHSSLSKVEDTNPQQSMENNLFQTPQMKDDILSITLGEILKALNKDA